MERNRIRPFRNQPRKYFDQGEMAALAESIKQIGQVTPILIKPVDSKNYDFELIDGQRRWHACGMIKMLTLKAIVTSVENENHQFVISTVSNFARSSHTPMETAYAIKRIREMGHSYADIARMLGRSYTWVIKMSDLLKLVPEVQALLDPALPREKKLPTTAAQELARFPPDLQFDLASRVIDKGLSSSTANLFLRNKASQAKLIHSRDSSAYDDLRKMKSFLDGAFNKVEAFMFLPSEVFEAIPVSSKFGDLQSRVEALILQLKQLGKRMK